MKNYLKFFIIALAVAVIVPQVALAAWWNPFSWGIWNRIFHFQQQVQKSETPKTENESKPVTDETAGWKTYNESDFNFSFKYPNSWKVDDGLTAVACCLNLTNSSSTNEVGLSKGIVKMQFQNYNKPANKTLKDFVASQTYMESNVVATSIKEVNIAGINGIFSNLTADGTYYLPQSSTQGISITIFNHPESREQFKATIDKVLSTFKFTTPVSQTADWKTYKNSEYGFQINYPENFSVQPGRDYFCSLTIHNEGDVTIEDREPVLFKSSSGVNGSLAPYIKVCRFFYDYKRLDTYYGYPVDPKKKDISNIYVDNHNGFVIKYVTHTSESGESGLIMNYFLDNGKSSSYLIYTFWPYPNKNYNDNDLKAGEIEIGNIIKTFKFVN